MNDHTEITTEQSDSFPALTPMSDQVFTDRVPAQPSVSVIPPQDLNLNYLVPALPHDSPVTPRNFSTTPFADLPLYIPGITVPVVGFDGGINLAALEVHLGQGLLCALLPYVDMAELDFVELFCGDTLVPVAVYPVTSDDVTNENIIPLYIPHSRLPDGPANPVFLRLTRLGGGTAETKHLNLKVDTVAPGGTNPVGSTLQNENLAPIKLPQNVIDFGVTQEDANNGVPVTFDFYPVDRTESVASYRKPRDRIRLSIGGRIFEHRVTEGEASNQDPITVTLYAGFWAQVGSGSRVCEYQVIDEVGNASHGWSPAVVLNVELNDGSEPLLIEPYIDEVPEDILDYEELAGSDATIRVFIRTHGYAVGDIIRATVNGRAVDGTPIVTTYDSAPLTSITVVQISIPFPNADVRALVGGRLQLSYKRIRAGQPERGSRSIIVQVSGTPAETGLARPRIIEAVDGVLDPQLLFVNVEVLPYPGQAPFDLVTLILAGNYANGNAYYRELDEIGGTDSVLFMIPNGPTGDFARLEGGSLRIYYRVTSADGSETRLSLDESLMIGSPVATLPEPRVLQALPPAYWFDTDASTGNASIRVLPNADIKEGDTVILRCEGNAPGGTAPPQDFPISLVWVGRELPFTLLRQYITPNQTMRIYYTRVRDNAPTRFSHEVNMRVGTRLELTPPRVLEATSTGDDTATLNPLNVLPPHSPVVTIRVTSNAFPPGADIKLFITGKPGVGMPDIPAKAAIPEPGENYTSFTVPNSFVAAYLGGECKVFYNLLQNGGTTKSEELTLTVEALPEQVLDLVSVPESSGDVIDANTPANVRIDKWAFFAAGQAVFIELVHTDGDRTVRDGKIVSATEFSAGHTLDVIPSDYLEALPDGSTLTINAKVSVDGTGIDGTALNLRPRTYTLSVVPKLTIPEDTRVVNLGGWLLRGFGTNELAYLPSTRPATGGQPPYIYRSSNSAVVSIYHGGERINIEGPGTATITVTDSSTPPQAASYQVEVTGSYRTCWYSRRAPYFDASNGGRLPSLSDCLSLRSRFGNNFPTTWYSWRIEKVPGNPTVAAHMVVLATGGGLTPPYTDWGAVENYYDVLYIV